MAFRNEHVSNIGDKKTLYVSGYWMLPENQKWDVAHYSKTIEKTIRMLRGNDLIFFFADSWVRELVSALSDKYEITIRLVRIEVGELPAASNAKTMVNRCTSMKLDSVPNLEGPRCWGEEKALVHYWRDLKGSGPRLYEMLLSIWLSKVQLVSQVVAQEQARYRQYAWVDASVSQFEGKRSNWNFMVAPIRERKINHYGSLMTYFGRRLPLNASFLCGPQDAWVRLERCYLAQLRNAAIVPYAHDEETVLGFCVAAEKELFNKIGDPFQRAPLGDRMERAFSGLLGFIRPGIKR